VNTTIRITRPVGPVMPHSRLLRAVGAVQVSLRALVGRASRKVPDAVGPMTRALEAAAAREYAVQFLRSDPRFAADLCAAADRHERGENA